MTRTSDLRHKPGLAKASRRVCVVRGCQSKIDSARSMCNGHYCAWWREVRLNDPVRQPRCDVCAGPHHARGWCRKHYMNWLLRGDPTKIAERPLVLKCRVRGCTKTGTTEAGHGYCGMHKARVDLYGTPGGSTKRKVGKPPTVDGIPQSLRRKATRIHYLWFAKGIQPTEQERKVHQKYARLVKELRAERQVA